MPKLELYIAELKNSLAEIYSVEEAQSVAEFYVCEKLNLSRTDFILNKNKNMLEIDFFRLEEDRKRLEQGEPVQYVCGKAYFYGLDYFVNKNVLIPRQETEVIVDYLVKKYQKAESIKILDIGTGSGCIAISQKKHLPDAIVYALDISPAALEVCKNNAATNNVEIETFVFDILSENTFPIKEKFDLIISNPPYVLESEKQLMHMNVLNFEPVSALYVNDENPLIYYKKIAKFAAQNIKLEGELCFEINEIFANEVLEINKACGFTRHKVIDDLNCKPRFVCSHF